MATLSSLLSSKSLLTDGTEETNLEGGRLWGYSPQNHSEFSGGGAKFYGCQISNDNAWVGEVEVEMWGAGGRGNSCSCCCASGPGGNPGSYIRFKTIMTRSGFICTTGMRACQSGAHCQCGGQGSATCAIGCAGCILNTCVYTCSCACAQAGLGGRSMCISGGASMMCCLGTNGACITPNVDYEGNAVSDGCGMVCNVGNANNWPTVASLPVANYTNGGNISSVVCCNSDINRVACIFYGHCNQCCWNCHRQIIHTAPMRYSTCGGEMQLNHGWSDNMTYQGSPFGQMDAAVQGMSRSPTAGLRPSFCWQGSKMCTCYEWTGCTPFWPIAQSAPSDFACSGVRTHGFTGGHGAIRIKYLGNITVY